MKLNLGCGDRYADGWINVDHAGSPHRKDLTIDLSANILVMPMGKGVVQYAYAGHVLEHLTLEQCSYLLDGLQSYMHADGELLVVGPDLDRARPMAEDGTLDVPLDGLVYGGHRWPGDVHQYEATAALTTELLVNAGWIDVTEIGIGNVPEMWPVADRRPVWQFAITARVKM